MPNPSQPSSDPDNGPIETEIIPRPETGILPDTSAPTSPEPLTPPGPVVPGPDDEPTAPVPEPLTPPAPPDPDPTVPPMPDTPPPPS